jgi:hypothetical protein
MNGQKFTPRLKAGGLWAKTSAKGARYLTDRLGGVKVLILANKDRQSDSDPSHILYFAEAPDRRQGGQERGEDPGRVQMPSVHQTPSQPQHSGFQTHATTKDDDTPPWGR